MMIPFDFFFEILSTDVHSSLLLREDTKTSFDGKKNQVNYDPVCFICYKKS